MKLNTKKIVAREILILISVPVLCGFLYLGLSIRNSVINEQSRQALEKLNKLESSIDSLAALPWNRNWKRLEFDQLSKEFQDSLLVLLTISAEQGFTDEELRIQRDSFLQNIGPEKGRIYNEANSPKVDLEYAIANSDTINLLNQESQSLRSSINKNPFDVNTWVIYLAIVLIGILYVLRPLIYVIIWAVRTLKK